MRYKKKSKEIPIALGLAFIVIIGTTVIVWDNKRQKSRPENITPSLSELLIQVNPTHASVAIDSGKRQNVGRDGVVIQTDANRSMSLSITADGYLPKTVVVESPDSGRASVIFELTQNTDEIDDET